MRLFHAILFQKYSRIQITGVLVPILIFALVGTFLATMMPDLFVASVAIILQVLASFQSLFQFY